MVKIVDNGYILAVSATATGGVEIAEQEYNAILTSLHNRPQSKDGFALMLKDGTLEWAYTELPPISEEPTTEDKAEAYDILIGGDDNAKT